MNPQLPDALNGQLRTLRSGSLCFWGHWFGRPHDNSHRIVAASSIDGASIIYFDGGESLCVEQPEQWSLDGGRLVIGDARRVRFQWFYYGRRPSPDTLRFREYRRGDDGIVFATDFEPSRHIELNPDAPAVELHSREVGRRPLWRVLMDPANRNGPGSRRGRS